MQKIEVYQLDSAGNTKNWSIEVIDHGTHSEILSFSGIIGGAQTPTSTLINVGKGKETHFTQAVKEATSKMNSKIKKGYVADITQIKASDERGTEIKAPMKGQKYHPTGKNGGHTLDKLNFRNKRIGLQRKLDGFRYRIKIDKNSCVFHSSSGDVVPNFPQVEKQLRRIFDKSIGYWESKYGITEYILDGEMYNHSMVQKLGFEAIQKACGTRKIDANTDPYTMQLRNELQFHLYDVVLEAPYTTRNKIISSFIDNVSVMEVETIEIIGSEEVIEEYFEEFLAAGYEGLMLRVLDLPYEHKKGKQLIKYKPIMDEEFKIVGFEKSVTGDTLGALICIDDQGRTFNSDCKDALGTDVKKQEIWDNQSEYLGKYVTVDFLNYTKAGLPRHPKAKCLRKGPSQD